MMRVDLRFIGGCQMFFYARSRPIWCGDSYAGRNHTSWQHLGRGRELPVNLPPKPKCVHTWEDYQTTNNPWTTQTNTRCVHCSVIKGSVFE